MLSEKKIQFCENYIANGYNGRKAYMDAFDTDNKNVSGVEACRFLKDSQIQEKIEEIEGTYRIVGHRLSIDKQVILKRIKVMLEATKVIYHNGAEVGQVPDWTAINSAIVTYAKLVGDFAPDKKTVTFSEVSKDTSKMTKKEREELKKNILKEL